MGSCRRSPPPPAATSPHTPIPLCRPLAGRFFAVKSIPKVLDDPQASERKKAEQIPYLRREVRRPRRRLAAPRRPGTAQESRHPATPRQSLQRREAAAAHLAARKRSQCLSRRRRCRRAQVEVLLALRGTLNVANLEDVYEDGTHVHLVGTRERRSPALGA